jgi:hypothetical protein
LKSARECFVGIARRQEQFTSDDLQEAKTGPKVLLKMHSEGQRLQGRRPPMRDLKSRDWNLKTGAGVSVA